MLEMDRLLQNVRLLTFGVLAVAFIACGPWIGWQTLPLLFFAGIFFALADGRAEKVKRPEYWIFGAWVGAQLMIAAAVVLTDAPELVSVIWFALPVVTLSTRFSTRGVVAGVLITLVLLFAVMLGSDAASVGAYPPRLIMPTALIVGVAILSTGERLIADRGLRSVARFDATGKYVGPFAAARAMRLAVGPAGWTVLAALGQQVLLLADGRRVLQAADQGDRGPGGGRHAVLLDVLRHRAGLGLRHGRGPHGRRH